MKASRTQKKLKGMPYPPQKKAFKRKRKSYYTSKDQCPNLTNLIRRPKINNSNLSKRHKELKMKLGQLQEEISKATLPVGADLSKALNQLFWKLTKEKCTPFMKLILEE